MSDWRDEPLTKGDLADLIDEVLEKNEAAVHMVRHHHLMFRGKGFYARFLDLIERMAHDPLRDIRKKLSGE